MHAERAHAIMQELRDRPEEDYDYYVSLVVTGKDAAHRLGIPSHMVWQWYREGYLSLLDRDAHGRKGRPTHYYFLPDVAEVALRLLL